MKVKIVRVLLYEGDEDLVNDQLRLAWIGEGGIARIGEGGARTLTQGAKKSYTIKEIFRGTLPVPARVDYVDPSVIITHYDEDGNPIEPLDEDGNPIEPLVELPDGEPSST